MLEGSVCVPALNTVHGTSGPLVLFGDQVLRTQSSRTAPTFKHLNLLLLLPEFYFKNLFINS